MHVLQMPRKVEGRVPPFEALRERIAEVLREASWRRAVQGRIGMLAARVRIAGFGILQGRAAPPLGAWPAGAACVAAPRRGRRCRIPRRATCRAAAAAPPPSRPGHGVSPGWRSRSVLASARPIGTDISQARPPASHRRSIRPPS